MPHREEELIPRERGEIPEHPQRGSECLQQGGDQEVLEERAEDPHQRGRRLADSQTGRVMAEKTGRVMAEKRGAMAPEKVQGQIRKAMVEVLVQAQPAPGTGGGFLR